MRTTVKTYLKFIPYLQFDLWDTKRYTSKSITSFYKVVELGNCINEENKKYKLFEEEDREFGILGVNNKTGIFDAYLQKGKDINQAYKKMEVGWLAFNPYRINVGSIGVKLSEHKNEYISPAYVVFSCKNNILPEYLFLLFKTNTFNKVINESTTGSVRQNLTIEILKKLKIPLPSLVDQERIVNNYHKLTNEAETLERQTVDLEGEIKKVIFTELEIKEQKAKFFSNKLKIINSAEIERWGVEFIIGSDSSQVLKSAKFNNQRLSDIVQINPRTTFPKENIPISFIPMECISDEYGEVIELREKLANEAKGYTKFIEGDLLWARITPCMQNGKSAIVKNLKNRFGCGSTEYHIIRNTNPEIDLEYIYHLLRLDSILINAMSHFTGSAGQQRVPKSFLEELIIPLPPFNIQRDISIRINNIKSIKKQNKLNAFTLREKAQQEFENAIFT